MSSDMWNIDIEIKSSQEKKKKKSEKTVHILDVYRV